MILGLSEIWRIRLSRSHTCVSLISTRSKGTTRASHYSLQRRACSGQRKIPPTMHDELWRPGQITLIASRQLSILPYVSSSSVAIDKELVPSEERSVAWRHIYDQFPSSFGISDFWGFKSMVPAGTLLPAKKTATLENLEANIHRGDFSVQCRHTPRDAPVDIISVPLENLRRAEKRKTNVKIMLEVDKTLLGTFTAWDTYTRSRIWVGLDAGVACRGKDQMDIITTKD